MLTVDIDVHGKDTVNLFDDDDFISPRSSQSLVLPSPAAKYRLFCFTAINQTGTEEGNLDNLGTVGDEITFEKSYGQEGMQGWKQSRNSSYCLGLIGNGPTFCIKKGCKQKHKGGAVKIESGTLFVSASANAAFLEPTLEVDQLSRDAEADWMSKRATLDDWSRSFMLVKNLESPVTLLMIQEAITLATQSAKMKTPKRSPSQEEQDEDLVSEHPSLVTAYNRILDQMENKFSGDIDVDDDGLRVMENVGKYIEASSIKIKNLEKSSKISQYKISEDLALLFSRISMIESTVGTRIDSTLAEHQAPNIWSSLSLISDALVNSTTNITSIKEENNSLHMVQEKLQHEMVESINNQNYKIKNLQEVLDNVTKRMDNLRNLVTANIKVLVERINDDDAKINDVSERVVNLTKLGDMYIGHGHFDATESSSTIRAIEKDLELQKSVSSRLESKINDLVLESRKDAVRFCGLGFRKYEEASEWVEENDAVGSFGLIVDAHIVFEHLHNEAASPGSLASMQLLAKVKVGDISQGLAISSFDTRCPKCLSGTAGFGKIKRDESFFDKCKTNEDWSEASIGMRDQLKEALSDYSDYHKNAVIDKLDTGTKEYQVAVTSLLLTISWIEAFFLFIDETYKELTTAKFSSVKGWNLITRLAHRILYEISVPRNGVAKSFVTGETRQTSKQILWAVCQSHDKMESYKKACFKDDPSISAEYVKFLVLNTGMEAVDKVSKRSLDLEATVKALKEQVKVADTKANTASNQAADTKKILAELTRRLGVLEKTK